MPDVLPSPFISSARIGCTTWTMVAAALNSCISGVGRGWHGCVGLLSFLAYCRRLLPGIPPLSAALLTEMKQEGCPPVVTCTFNMAMIACNASSQWQVCCVIVGWVRVVDWVDGEAGAARLQLPASPAASCRLAGCGCCMQTFKHRNQDTKTHTARYSQSRVSSNVPDPDQY